MRVIKRDGHAVEFDKSKIVNAITKAFQECYDQMDLDMWLCATKIAEGIERNAVDKELTVEEIQDMVERRLMGTRYKDVAKAYTNYRYLRKMARDRYADMMDAIAEKLTASNVQNQNANVDEMSFGGRVGEASDLIMRKYALEYLVSPMARRNHENNEIYIHDLNAYAVGNHNCLSVPFDDLLANGFNTRQTDVRPAQSINTAFQLVAVIFQIQSLQQFGGVSATHLDWTMVPYVRKSFHKHWIDGINYIEGCGDIVNSSYYKEKFDDRDIADISIEDYIYDPHIYHEVYRYAMNMTVKECNQAVEGMYHNLNIWAQ